MCACLPDSSAEKVSFLCCHCFCSWWKLARTPALIPNHFWQRSCCLSGSVNIRGWLVSAAFLQHGPEEDGAGSGGHPCTGAWLSPPGLRKGNSQWSYSPGLALVGTLLGIVRGLGFQPLCSHFVTSRHRAWSCQHRSSALWGLPSREEAGGFVPSLLWCRVLC